LHRKAATLNGGADDTPGFSTTVTAIEDITQLQEVLDGIAWRQLEADTNRMVVKVIERLQKEGLLA